MNTQQALALIDKDHGGIEEFALRILSEAEVRDVVLDETESAVRRAEAAGLSLSVFSRIINHPAFKAALRTHMVNARFGFFDEQQHIEAVAKVATGEERKVMSPRGEIGYVDQAPADVIAAGRYLNELRGTPTEVKGGGGPGSINIQIINANSEGRPAAEVTLDIAANVHEPGRAGDLPPAGVLERGSAAAPKFAAETAGFDSGRAEPAHHDRSGITLEEELGRQPSPGRARSESGGVDQIEAETKEKVDGWTERQSSERRAWWERLPSRTPVPAGSGRGSDNP